LEGNSLAGRLPENICRLTTLRHLRMRWNQVTGTVSPLHANMEFLEEIDLSGNRLGGTLDGECFSGLAFLKLVNLSFNELHGDIPDSWSDCSQVSE
jgi:hypothetical protein